MDKPSLRPYFIKHCEPALQRGFTLIELSIVLVIIGLIIGGVLVGQSLLKAAELRKITTQFNSYITAAQTFRLKYGGLPGDLPNATQFWGTDPTGCPYGADGSVMQTTTCNGNGDGQIGSADSTACAVNQYNFGATNFHYICFWRENFTFWQQLANAGLIDGQYSGAYGNALLPVYSGGNGFIPGKNVPEANYPCLNPRGCAYSKLIFVAWSQYSLGGSYSSPQYIGTPYYNTISLTSIEGNFLWLGMTPLDTQSIDGKLDDGMANAGKIVATQVTGNCYNLSTGVYTTTITTGDCSLNYKNAF